MARKIPSSVHAIWFIGLVHLLLLIADRQWKSELVFNSLSKKGEE